MGVPSGAFGVWLHSNAPNIVDRDWVADDDEGSCAAVAFVAPLSSLFSLLLRLDPVVEEEDSRPTVSKFQ